jgi:hypothetical protein
VRSNVRDMLKKTRDIMKSSDEPHLTAMILAERMNLPVSTVYRLIRMMRVEGVGVHTTGKGYVLSEYATKRDDVNFMRRLNGRRTSDFFAMRASEPYIQKRWTSVEDRRNLLLIVAPLRVNLKSLDDGNKVLLESEKKYAPPTPKEKPAR